MIVLSPYSRLEVSETWLVLTIAKLRAQTGWSWNESKPACPSFELCLGLQTRSSEELAQNWVHSKFQSKVWTMLSCQVIYKNMATTNTNSKHFLDLVAAWNNQFLKVIILGRSNQCSKRNVIESWQVTLIIYMNKSFGTHCDKMWRQLGRTFIETWLGSF